MKIKVINQKGQPLKNIKVILYSEPQETLTNDEGIATFFNVIPGENRIVVQGEKEQTELNVNLTENKNMNGDNDFIVTIKEQNNWLTWIAIALFSSVLILGYLLTKNKNKN